ncbi:MAG: septal ring lytic transglycosylase RlpA family protein, partial [Verrucomicrobia bacterium]|nr:septal ring lytic transglycosylase RlpA family protein [Verrucomicrobiota bacterium]
MTPESQRDQSTSRGWRGGLFFVFCLFLAGCQTRMVIDQSPNGRDAQIYSGTPTLVEYGMASWYGGRWVGRLTANGETYRAGDVTAAHKKLPFNTRVRV